MKTGAEGIRLIKHFEGLRLKAYQCSAGVWTVGYGHTSQVLPGQTITEAEADRFLQQDLAVCEQTVNQRVRVPLTQQQFDALVSFVFNLGSGSFSRSALLQKLNSQDYTGAGNEFLRWTYAGGKVVPGLVRRREAEKALFDTSGP